MPLFTASFKTHEIIKGHGEREDVVVQRFRLVDAESTYAARSKVRAAYEAYAPSEYRVVEVEDLEIDPVLV